MDEEFVGSLVFNVVLFEALYWKVTIVESYDRIRVPRDRRCHYMSVLGIRNASYCIDQLWRHFDIGFRKMLSHHG